MEERKQTLSLGKSRPKNEIKVKPNLSKLVNEKIVDNTKSLIDRNYQLRKEVIHNKKIISKYG